MRLRNIPTARQELAESPYVIDETDISRLRGRWSEQFSSRPTESEASGRRPLHIEIGMGKGQFLLELAHRNPNINYVGIERYSSVLVHPVRKLEALTHEDVSGTDPEAAAQSAAQESALLQNVLLLRMDAEHLTEVFAPGEVDRIYLNFSDPWPKDRHAKRRLPGRVFLGRFEQILVPQGKVEFKTDNRSLFEFALEEAEQAGWVIDACTFDLHHDPVLNEGNILTEYEKRFSEMGNPICKLIEHKPI